MVVVEHLYFDDLYQSCYYVTTEETCWFSKISQAMAGGFRANIFDPLLIVAQIVAMQCSFYAFMGLWILLADIIGGIQPSVEQILDYRVSVCLSCVFQCVCVCVILKSYLRSVWWLLSYPSGVWRSLWWLVGDGSCCTKLNNKVSKSTESWLCCSLHSHALFKPDQINFLFLWFFHQSSDQYNKNKNLINSNLKRGDTT